MKKLLICFSLISLYSCDRVEYVEPTFTTINNVGLPVIKSNEYITCQVQTSTKLAVGQKLTKSEEKFNIAEYKEKYGKKETKIIEDGPYKYII